MEDLSEKEQIEQMRAWWSEYGNYVIGGVVVGVGLLVGTAQYRGSIESAQTEASVLYGTVFEAGSSGDVDEAEIAANDLYGNYASTVYAAQARLTMARLYMDEGRDEDAADALRAIFDAEPESELGLIARLRLAKVLLYQDKAQDVVDLLSNSTESAFAARFSEALGDALVVLGQYADAKDAYFVAMADNASMPTVDRVLVQMKIDDLPDEAVPEAATEEPATKESVTEEPATEEPATEESAEEVTEAAIDGDGESE